MKKFRIKARRYSESDWIPEYTETSVVNGAIIIGNNPQTPSGMHFRTEDEANQETLRLLKKQNIEDVEIIKHRL
jgi:hypothetical protein